MSYPSYYDSDEVNLLVRLNGVVMALRMENLRRFFFFDRRVSFGVFILRGFGR